MNLTSILDTLAGRPVSRLLPVSAQPPRAEVDQVIRAAFLMDGATWQAASKKRQLSNDRTWEKMQRTADTMSPVDRLKLGVRLITGITAEAPNVFRSYEDGSHLSMTILNKKVENPHRGNSPDYAPPEVAVKYLDIFPKADALVRENLEAAVSESSIKTLSALLKLAEMLPSIHYLLTDLKPVEKALWAADRIFHHAANSQLPVYAVLNHVIPALKAVSVLRPFEKTQELREEGISTAITICEALKDQTAAKVLFELSHLPGNSQQTVSGLMSLGHLRLKAEVAQPA